MNDSDIRNEVPVYEITIVLGILITLSIFSNSLVCCAFVIQPRLRRVLYYPVLNLAIADILCGAVAMTSYLAKKHVFGGLKQQIVCDISRFSYFVTEYASVLSLTIISVDRAIAIARPLAYSTTVTSARMKAVLALVWCYTTLVSSFPFFLRDTNDENCSFRPTKHWSIYVIVVNVLLPFFITTVCQATIYTIAVKHSIIIKKQKRNVTRDVEEQTALQKSLLRNDTWLIEKQATVTLSVVVGLFIISWGPSTVYYSIQTMRPQTFHVTFRKNQGVFNALVKLLTFLNSCFNPFIYAWLNKDFRTAFICVLRRRFYTSAVSRRNSRTRSRAANSML